MGVDLLKKARNLTGQATGYEYVAYEQKHNGWIGYDKPSDRRTSYQ
jgi:hypothetical protein